MFYALLAGGCALLGWIGHRLFVHSRREYRMTDEAVVLEVKHATDARPWVTRIPWTEIETYTAVNQPDAARLRVRSIRGFTLTLSEAPPTLATREFIRRFEAQADLYPRAVAPPLATDIASRGEEAGSGIVRGDEDASSGIGCILLIVGVIVVDVMEGLVGLSGGQRTATWVFVIAAMVAWKLWLALDDPDLAHADLTSRRWMARFRNWLRRVFNIPVV